MSKFKPRRVYSEQTVGVHFEAPTSSSIQARRDVERFQSQEPTPRSTPEHVEADVDSWTSFADSRKGAVRKAQSKARRKQAHETHSRKGMRL